MSPVDTVKIKAAGDAHRSQARKRRWDLLKRRCVPYLFLTPFLSGFLIFMVYPLIYTFRMSLFRTKIIGGTSFVGLENYARALRDADFIASLRTILMFGTLQVPLMLTLALASALLLDSGLIRLRNVLRLGYFLPFAVPSVITALVWGYLYEPNLGLIPQVAQALGLPAPDLLTKVGIMPAIANITTWQLTGYNMIIMYTALQGIPQDLYQAAKIDGATDWQIAWNIKIPMIKPAIVLTGIFSIISTLQLFNEPQILSATAPATIPPDYTPNMYIYYLAFHNRQFDYSATLAFSLAILIALISSLFLIAVNWRKGSI